MPTLPFTIPFPLVRTYTFATRFPYSSFLGFISSIHHYALPAAISVCALQRSLFLGLKLVGIRLASLSLILVVYVQLFANRYLVFENACRLLPSRAIGQTG